MIGADNQALEVLAANRSILFAGVPIFFCSVDGCSPDMLKGQEDITDVTGDLDFEGTISLARRLREAGQSGQRQQAQRPGPDRVLGGPELSEVIRRAGTFAFDTVVFDMAFLASDASKPPGVLSSTRKASEALSPPIYSCWETLLGK